ncbi:RNA polymerase sigma factor [Marixanthomonas spongiae]|uniref:RNA polymerase sigma factor n=1 Tax=Marixanthomonas spongiae TaxID=2174845 RepID=A0A2U0I3Z4_9FLAO|nr:RNA polymerase sigma factor [Marixanthomonas spongiae]PVW15832.1 RNA polymerase sigma factor [Marixanthomonas spongiae]
MIRNGTKNNLLNTSKTLTDSEVVNKVRSGQKELFELLIRRHNQLLFRVVRSYVDKEKDAEDVMQEAYIKAFQKLHQFRHDAKFSTWLVRIGINEALQRKRRLKTKQTINIEQTQFINQLENTAAMNPENQMIHAQSKAFIEEAIQALPEKYKIVYMLREVEQFSISEISESLQLSESNVKVRLHRAKKKMKKYLFKATKTSTVFEFGNSKCDRMVHNVMGLVVKI